MVKRQFQTLWFHSIKSNISLKERDGFRIRFEKMPLGVIWSDSWDGFAKCMSQALVATCCHCTSAVATSANSTWEHPFSCRTMMALNSSSSKCAPFYGCNSSVWICGLYTKEDTLAHHRRWLSDKALHSNILLTNSSYRNKLKLSESLSTMQWGSINHLCKFKATCSPLPAPPASQPSFCSYIYTTQTGFGDLKCLLCMILVWMWRTFRKITGNWVPCRLRSNKTRADQSAPCQSQHMQIY